MTNIPHTTLARHSSFYASKPMGPADQPDYVNAAAELHTTLQPRSLLTELQIIELRHGRKRTGVHWGPRSLDLDILLFGDTAIDTERLRVPHAGLHERDFALRPLLELDASLCVPDGTRVAQLAAALPPGALYIVSSVGG
jgi:2-amino-4-hydroxy-6-hydroxymethyldihydropteridine diphosphokinase